MWLGSPWNDVDQNYPADKCSFIAQPAGDQRELFESIDMWDSGSNPEWASIKDTRVPPGLKMGQYVGVSACTGVLYFRNRNETISLLNEWQRLLDDEYNGKDQPAFEAVSNPRLPERPTLKERKKKKTT